MEQVTVKIKDGKAVVEMDGFVGKACDSIADVLKNVSDVTSVENKPEYFDEVDAQQGVQQ